MGVLKNSRTGNYYIRVKYHNKSYEKVIGKDKRTAEIALNEIQQDIRLAKLAGQDWEGFKKLQRATRPKTFAEAANDYVEERANYKASSIRTYRSILDKYLLPAFGSTALKQLTESQLRRYQVKLSASLSPKRVNNIMQLFSSICDQEVRAGKLDRNPIKAVRPLQEPKVKIDPLSEDELMLALSHIEPHYLPFFATLAFTGARPNELKALRWTDIDWVKEIISISKGRVRGVEGLPKTRSGERLIPMTVQVKAVLKKLQASKLRSKDGYVFVEPDGHPLAEHLDRIWTRALKRAGLRHRPSYQLRHTFATQAIIRGLPVPYIAKILGHSTIDSLVRNYTGWIDGYTKENNDKLLKAFNDMAIPQPKVVQLKKGGLKGGSLDQAFSENLTSSASPGNWRRGRDSNPRCAFGTDSLSRTAR